MYRIGIDVGGTFTDFTLLEEASGSVSFHKVASTPQDPSEAIERGIADLLASARRSRRARSSHVGHGTTVATNLVIERKGARDGTHHDQGLSRRARDRAPDAAAPVRLSCRASRRRSSRREHRIEFNERVNATRRGADGSSTSGRSRTRRQRLAADGVRSVAICFLHSYRNPRHERARASSGRARDAGCLRQRFERGVAGIPRVRAAVDDGAQRRGRAAHGALPRSLSRAREGARHHGRAVHRSIRTAGSCRCARCARFRCAPACRGRRRASSGAAAVGRAAGYENLVTFDVGGTSTDVSLVVARQAAVQLQPRRSPTIRSRRRWSTST